MLRVFYMDVKIFLQQTLKHINIFRTFTPITGNKNNAFFCRKDWTSGH